jgi:hypothetical protein
MTDQSDQKRGRVPLKSFLCDFRSPLTDAELREKYSLSVRNFVSLIKALLERNLVTPQDLARRNEMTVQRDLAKESEFLSGLYICPHCSHPHPSPFRTCPACGRETGDAFAAQELLQSIFGSPGDHEVATDGEILSADEPQLLDTSELSGSRPEETEKQSQDKEKEKSKSSARDAVRSFISKLKKK